MVNRTASLMTIVQVWAGRLAVRTPDGELHVATFALSSPCSHFTSSEVELPINDEKSNFVLKILHIDDCTSSC